jgi:hypothetical protein
VLVRLPWKRGPAPPTAAFVAVTRTDFARHRDIPAAFANALRLRRAFPRTPGAIGLSLAMGAPWRKRTWSISAWSTPEDLQRFLGSPEHVAIVRRFRGRVTVRSETWPVPRFVLRDAWRTGREQLAGDPTD